MIAAALTAAIVIAFDCACAALAHRAAARFGLELTFFRRATPVLLVVCAALQVAVVLRYGSIRGIGIMAVAGVAGICAFTDAQTGYVFDALTFPALALTLAAAYAASAFVPAVAGAAATGGALFLLYALTRGRGLGLGDVKLACCIGAALGVAAGLRSLQLAFVFGGICALALLLFKVSRRGDALPFAPFLFAGMILAALGDS